MAGKEIQEASELLSGLKRLKRTCILRLHSSAQNKPEGDEAQDRACNTDHRSSEQKVAAVTADNI